MVAKTLRHFFERAVETLVGLLALTIAGLTAWTIVDVIVHPPETGASRATIIAICYGLGIGTMALGVFGLRLILPFLRIQGGRIIGLRGAIGFSLAYAAIIVLGLTIGSPTPAQILLGIVILVSGVSFALRRFRESRSASAPPNGEL